MGLHDECGVVGIYGAENAAALSYFALTSLQHRGQESAGIAVSDGKKIKLHKDDSDLISGISVQLAGMKGSILTSMNDIIQMRSFVGSDIERFDNDYIEYIYKYYKLKDKVKTLYILVNSEYTLKYFSITVGNNNY